MTSPRELDNDAGLAGLMAISFRRLAIVAARRSRSVGAICLVSLVPNDFTSLNETTLTESLQELFGAKAFIARERPGVIIASAGRPLTGDERATLHLFQQVTPVAPGVRIEIVGQVEDVPFFGFGAGWGGLCESLWLQ